MRKRYWLFLSTLIFGSILFFADRFTHQASYALVNDDEHEAEFYGEQLINRHYNRNGYLQQTMVAEQSAHYPHRQVTEFSMPQVTTADNDGQHWHLRSDRGHLSDAEQRIHFNDNVTVRSLDDDDPIQMTTHFLVYQIDTQQADTDKPVRLQSPHSVTTATGLHLNIPQQQLLLHSEVSTHHAPASKP